MPRTLAALFCLLIVAFTTSAAPAAEPLAKHVVLITMDGLPAYLFDDPSAVIPNIRAVAARGIRAEGMTVSNPSVTWPNHTTLVTGVTPAKHSVIFNGLLERPGIGLPVRVNPRKDKVELVAVPTVYDHMHAAGLEAAEINWPCTRAAKSLAISLPDSPEVWDHTTPELITELKETGILSEETLTGWNRLSGPARDRVWTQAACHVIRTRQPNLLLFHLLNVDSIHHQHSAKSSAGYSAVAYADACIGEVLAAIEEAGIADETAVLITSDHGFIAIPKTLKPNVLFREHGLLTLRGNTVDTAKAYVIPEGGTALVYLTSPDSQDADRETVLKLLKDHEGIERILLPEDYEEFGLPTPTDNRLAPDLVLAAKDGYGFSGDAAGAEVVTTATGTPGTHGFLSTNPMMNATFVAAGAGIQPGAQLDIFPNTRVAPTIARLLGIDLPGADGKPLDEILTPTAQSVGK